MTDPLLWFCDQRDEAAVRSALHDRRPHDVIVGIAQGVTLRRTIRAAVLAHPTSAAIVLCGGTVDDEQAASAVSVSAILEASGVQLLGCPTESLQYSATELDMLLIYGAVAVTPRAIISTVADAATCTVPLPSIVYAADMATSPVAVNDAAARASAVTTQLQISPRIVVASNPPGVTSLRIAASEGRVRWWSDNLALDFTTLAEAVAHAVVPRRGFVTASVVKGDGDTWTVVRCDLTHMTWLCSVNELDAILESQQRVARASYEAAKPAHRVLHTPGKGFHVEAARDIVKGDIVFPDEESPITLVTRPYVERYWSPEKQQLFKEYAWPVDDGGHVYAMWAEHPKQWRPINHSCDPNLVFATPHSLNVVAARDIPQGTDLTIDYVTFCDSTMQPFNCMCGSSNCRNVIRPTERDLAIYGQSAFRRRFKESPSL